MPTNAQTAFEYLTGKGLSPAAAAGIIGNLMVESGLNPLAVGDSGTSFGIAQWHLGRADALRRFGGADWQDLTTQLDFLMHELQTSYGSVLRSLRTAASPSQAAAAFAAGFERPASTDYSQRQANAVTILQSSRSNDWSTVSSPSGGGGGNHGWESVGHTPGQRDIAAGTLASILRGFGLNPDAFGDLIHQAITEQWSPAQFQSELYASPEFSDMFPGIFNRDGSLKMTPAQYLQMSYGDGGYVDIAREWGLRLNRDKIGELIGGNVSPTEWAFRAEVKWTAENDEVFGREFARVSGIDFSRKDWFDAVAGKTTNELTDLYEAAFLRSRGLDIGGRQGALDVARQIGAEGERVDLNKLVSQVRQIQDFVAPELRAAGITEADLTVLEAGSDPRNLQGKLDQILRNRQALLDSPLARTTSGSGGMFPARAEGF